MLRLSRVVNLPLRRMRIEILAADPATCIVKFSSAAGAANATWSGELPSVGINVDVEIDIEITLSHDNTTVLPTDSRTAIEDSRNGVTVVAIVEQIDDDGMLFMRIDGDSTFMVESATDFVPRLGDRLMIRSTVDSFRLTPFIAP